MQAFSNDTTWVELDSEAVANDVAMGNGSIEEKRIDVTHTWIVDQAEATEQYVKKTYPNGGKDIGERVISPEIGHWETRDSDGKIVPMSNIPDGYPHDVSVPDVFQYQIYTPYTPEELAAKKAEREKQEAEAQAAKDKAQARESMLDALPDYQTETDLAICELYEMISGESM